MKRNRCALCLPYSVHFSEMQYIKKCLALLGHRIIFYAKYLLNVL